MKTIPAFIKIIIKLIIKIIIKGNNTAIGDGNTITSNNDCNDETTETLDTSTDC